MPGRLAQTCLDRRLERLSRRRENMSRLGRHLALPTKAPGHLLDEMRGGGDFRLLALGYPKPGPSERRFDLCRGHTLRFHDALSLIHASRPRA
jgi:hypothetical protein